ncbi:inactive poly [ADP-ribose] polymerase RCD1-like isoform X2 [Aristolochia californica]|uniref:inactive poly [ADP-ribose] polymerase RCD1-like isoform X2 n=1 Tax=Aristolochia californica TaxID=171875 RepID=UPI0035DA630F
MWWSWKVCIYMYFLSLRLLLHSSMENVNLSRISGSKRKLEIQSSTGQRAKFAYASIKNQELVSARWNVAENCSNFSKSMLPRRVMFYSDKEWKDFPEDMIPLVVDAFKSKRSAVDVAIASNSFLVDFLRMTLFNLETGTQQSVAWIDQSDKCFFPKYCFDIDNMPRDNDDTEMKLEIDISVEDSSEPKNRNKIGRDSEANEVIAENGVPCLDASPNTFGFDSVVDSLVAKVEVGSKDYLTVQNTFLRGFGESLKSDNIISIYRYMPTGCSALARSQSFEKQIEITKTYRGDANVRLAWHGSSGKSIGGILRYGFGMDRRPLNGVAYGTGIYFSPEDCSHVSAKDSDVDENGMQHMMLCQVIMGCMELVQPGSKQFHPSSEKFDSGVDNLQNPKHYVVWSTHMNTHIHPEYVVAFKLPPPVREQLVGPKLNVMKFVDNKSRCLQVKPPTSPWMPIPMIFDAIQNNISSQAKDALDRHYNDFESKLITRVEFVRQLRLIVGDKLLRSTLTRFHCKICDTKHDHLRFLGQYSWQFLSGLFQGGLVQAKVGEMLEWIMLK